MFDLGACIGGDKKAWDAFVERFARVIFAAVHRTLARYGAAADEAEVQDVAQEVFVRLIKDDYRLLRRYDPSKSRLTTWLTIVARSTAIDHVRRPTLPTVPLGPGVGGQAEAPAEPPRGIELPPDLLSARQQLVMRLLFDEQMTAAQAAEMLGVETQTIRSTRHKAIQKLRDFFGGG